MGRFTPALQLAQVLVCGLNALIAVAIVGLGGHLIMATQMKTKGRVWIEYQTGYTYTWLLPYLPLNLSFARPAVLVAGAALACLLNAVVGVLVINRRNLNERSGGRKYYEFYPKMIVIVCDAVALVLVLAATIYGWSDTVHDGDQQPRFPVQSDASGAARWDQKFVFDPIYWNCAVYSLIRKPSDPGPAKKLCAEGTALLDLTILLLLLQASALGLHFWLRRRMSKSFADNVVKENQQAESSSSYKMDDLTRRSEGHA